MSPKLGAPTLEAFDCAYMEASMFREMLARTFNLRLTVGELGAVMRFFDPEFSGRVKSQDFLIHFFKTGFSERRKSLTGMLKKQREAIKEQKREAEVTYLLTD